MKFANGVLFYFVIFFSFSPKASAQMSTTVPEAATGFWDFSWVISVFENGVQLILGTIGILSILGFGVALILYLTAGDSEDRLHDSSWFFLRSLLGIFISVGGIFIFGYLKQTLGI